jgi:uncharacterized coiled-coil protein SlyX
MADVSRDEAVRYLLGESSEADREAIEQRFFQDETLSDEIACVEDDLVDAYVNGRLTAGERGRFEQGYLGPPERAAKLAFARALQRRLAEPDRTMALGSRSRWPLSLAAAVFFGAAGAYFAYRFADTSGELSRLEQRQASLERRQTELSRQLAEAQGERARLAKELEQTGKEAGANASEVAASQTDVAGTVAFVLSGGLLRDAGSQNALEIPRGATKVKLSMSIPSDDHASYSAVIRTPEGREIWRGVALNASRLKSGHSLAMLVPAHVLTSGDYILTVNAVTTAGRRETLADYAFRIKAQ